LSTKQRLSGTRCNWPLVPVGDEIEDVAAAISPVWVFQVSPVASLLAPTRCEVWRRLSKALRTQ
jgi:hypothetical protein